MSITELIPTVKALPRLDKFQLLQFLVSEIGREEGFLPLNPSATYPVWTPYNTPEATAVTLAAMLEGSNNND